MWFYQIMLKQQLNPIHISSPIEDLKLLSDCRNFVTHNSSSIYQILQTRVFKVCNVCLKYLYMVWHFQEAVKCFLLAVEDNSIRLSTENQKAKSNCAQFSAAVARMLPVYQLVCSELPHTPLLCPVTCRISSLPVSRGRRKGEETENMCDFLIIWHWGHWMPGNSPSREGVWTNLFCSLCVIY